MSVNASYNGFEEANSKTDILQESFHDRSEKHDRFVDSIVEQSLAEFDLRGADLVLVETDFYDENEFKDIGEKGLEDVDYSLPVNRSKLYKCKGDIDLAVLDLE